MAHTKTIAQLFRVPSRFVRSVQLERDFHDDVALDNYIVTPPMAEAIRRITMGLAPNSGRRAWRITGDYGVGKSSFALVLAHLLSGATGRAVSRIGGEIGWSSDGLRMWPILLTASRQGIVQSLAGGIAAALRQRAGVLKRRHGVKLLLAKAERAQRDGDTASIEALLADVSLEASRDGAGVLFVIDELGKLLEFAAGHPDGEDIFVLQRLAELAARSGAHPLLLVGLLHQGFHAYADRLPSISRHEWEKVAGRFDEIVFDQPLAHTAALVAGALNLDSRRLPVDIREAASEAARSTAATGWLGGATTGAATLDAARLYPMHPTLLPVLVRFFARFGQHERSLFSFLLSSEPFALQAFSSRSVDQANWYRLSDFYDYARASFGHRLAGGSYRSHWLRIVQTIDSAPALTPVGERVLKTVAVLNLLDADDLLATDRALDAALSPLRRKALGTEIENLLNRGLLFRRGTASGYRLWPQSSINLDVAFDTAGRSLGALDSVSAAVEPYVSREPILARRHYVERGTLRYFEVRVCRPASMADAVEQPSEGDGVFLIVLSDTESDRRHAIATASDAIFRERADVLISVSEPLVGLAPEVQDARCWDWIAASYPELQADPFSVAEVSRQRNAAQRSLARRLTECLGYAKQSGGHVTWFRQGKKVRAIDAVTLSAILSDICDDLYPKAPLISNELLNRNTLSSAAAAARMRLIEGLFAAGDRPLLGIDARKAPPEKSMYLSVIARAKIHVEGDGAFHVAEPTAKDDPLRLRPALDHLVHRIESAKGDRVRVDALLASLKVPPFGVRSGVTPLLLAILLRTRGHELALYENGTFLHRFGASDFLRLTKAPGVFEIQHCQVKGVRTEVFELLASKFADQVSRRPPDLLDVVRPLCQFAGQLPEYTRKGTTLSVHAVAVREALLTAVEPVKLLFRDLPEACGVSAFAPEQKPDRERVKSFVNRLYDAVGELRAAYPQLLRRVVGQVVSTIGGPRESFDRATLASRAARVSLAAREPRLRAFALRLRDPGLTDDAWAEALASFVVSKPPARWTSADEARFSGEIGILAELFYRVEATAFAGNTLEPDLAAIRVNLTRGDGEDRVRVVQSSVTADASLAAVAESFAGILPQDRQARLDLLTRLLWNELARVDRDEQAREPEEKHFGAMINE